MASENILKIFKGLKIFILTSFLLFSGPAIRSVSAQSQTDQIKRPVFLSPDEDAKEVINGKIYLSQKNNEKHENVNSPSNKFYFTDGQGKVLNTFKVFPSPDVLNTNMYVQHSKKYMTLRRSYLDGKNKVLDGFVLNNEGKVLWHMPKNMMLGYVFPDDKNDNVLLIDVWRGLLKIYGINGNEKSEKYYSDQNDKKYPDLGSPDEDTLIWGGCESSEDGAYIACSRATRDVKGFQSELTLLDSSGDIIFQNTAPESREGMPLKVFGELKIIVVKCRVDEMLEKRQFGSNHGNHYKYYGIDFSGKELWELDGDKYHLDRRDLKDVVVNVGSVEKTMDKFRVTPGVRKIDVKTGEFK